MIAAQMHQAERPLVSLFLLFLLFHFLRWLPHTESGGIGDLCHTAKLVFGFLQSSHHFREPIVVVQGCFENLAGSLQTLFCRQLGLGGLRPLLVRRSEGGQIPFVSRGPGFDRFLGRRDRLSRFLPL